MEVPLLEGVIMNRALFYSLIETLLYLQFLIYLFRESKS